MNQQPLAFLPEPSIDALIDTPLGGAPGTLHLVDSKLTLRRGKKQETVDLDEDFGVMISRSAKLGDEQEIFVELRQKSRGKWLRIGLKTKARTWPEIEKLPSLERDYPSISSADMKDLLGRIRGAMQINGRDLDGLVPLQASQAFVQNSIEQAQIVHNQGEDLIIRVPRYHQSYVWDFIASMLFSLMAFGLAMSFGIDGKGVGPLPLLVLFGVLMSYRALVAVVSDVHIEIEGKTLKTRHAPLPYLWNAAVPVADINQIYCVERKHQKKTLREYYYQVLARTHQGRDVVLVRELPHPELALSVERELEEHLGIVDRWMPHEYPKKPTTEFFPEN